MTTPDVTRELALVDAALDAGRVSAADERGRELQELALALRDEAPRARPQFAAELDRRLEAGFARPRRARVAWGSGWTPRVAVAGAVLVAAVVAGVLAGQGGGGESPRPPQAVAVGTKQAPSAPSATDHAARTPFNASAGQVAVARRVERGAQLTLAAVAGKLQDVADGVGLAAERHGGFVLSSNVTTGERGTAGGSVVVRVPTGQLQATLADIGRLARVRSRTESAQDVTGPFDRIQTNLGAALAERGTLTDRLRTVTGPKAIALRARLRAVRREIAGLSARLHDLRRRTGFATVTVTLEPERSSGGGLTGGGPGAALHDAGRALVAALDVLLRALGVLLPLGVLAALGWLGARAARRRRREAVLF